jgi:DNA-binding NarL/FixJ family response regulator
LVAPAATCRSTSSSRAVRPASRSCARTPPWTGSVGATNEEIAALLAIAPLTVKTHVNRAMTKVGAHDRARLVILAYEAGVLPAQ